MCIRKIAPIEDFFQMSQQQGSEKESRKCAIFAEPHVQDAFRNFCTLVRRYHCQGFVLCPRIPQKVKLHQV